MVGRADPMAMNASKFSIPAERVAEFCRRRHIRRLSVFGSALRDDFKPDSDVDLLVEFEPAQRVGFFDLVRMERELSQLMGGRKVDLRTPEDLSRYFRRDVIAGAKVQYDAASR
jgi:predicted nucleotidyltransferase